MKRLGIVVQRCHESVVGGAEALAWQYANLLKDDYEVEVLTTTAVDAAYWANALPTGVELRDGITIRRFHIDIGYTPYRSALFSYLLQDFDKYQPSIDKNGGGAKRPTGPNTHLPWSISLQEELIRHIGPYSKSLIKFIKENRAQYCTLLFVTYLYPTSYFGLLQVPPGYALFAPTLHDEQPAYLSAYKHAARRAGVLIWLSEGEQRLGARLWGDLPGSVVGMHIEATPRAPQPEATPYLLYSGRIDPNKGCGELFDHFLQFKRDHPSNLRLVLTGKDDILIPDHPDIDFRGFVSDEEKFALMAGAAVYMMPSGQESFSIVTLEAMAQKAPVLASGACEVIVDHIRRSEGGRIYDDYSGFASALDELLRNADLRREMGERGRKYVLENFTAAIVKRDLLAAVESRADLRSQISNLRSQMSDVRSQFSDLRSMPDRRQTPDSQTPPVPQIPHYVEPKSLDLSYTAPQPLPAGWTEAALREFVTSIQVEDGPEAELKNYANDDFKRFLYTLGLVPEETGLCILELGANPYFTTTLLQKFRQPDLHLANFFAADRESEGNQNVTIHQTGEVINYRYKHFNVEADQFPYAADMFDVVLFCEILEHLLQDPVHALAEIRRVLKPGGTLIVTTPNVARLENVRKMIAGENIYDPYSGYGPYGRHNREYTQQDLFSLLTANGFRPNNLFTADVSERKEPAESVAKIAALQNRRPELGQYIFCRSTLNSDAKQTPPVRPEWLYRSMHSEAN